MTRLRRRTLFTTGALAAGAPEDMIRMAVEDALREAVRVDTDPYD